MSQNSTTTVSDMSPVLDQLRYAVNHTRNSVVTHNGVFHADEILALATMAEADILSIDTFGIIRTRDDKSLADAAGSGYIVLDVSPATENGFVFDHHRHPEWCRADGARYATAGLLWAACGPIIAKKYGLNETATERFVEYIDNSVFRGVDAADCGVATSTELPTLNAMISAFNADDVNNKTDQDYAFVEAVRWAHQLLHHVVRSTVARVEKLAEVEGELLEQVGEPVLVITKALPWKECVLEHWDEFQNSKLIVYPDGPGAFRIQPLPAVKDNPFSQRCTAPDALKGYRWNESDTQYLAGKPVIFVHPGGFTGGVRCNLAVSAVRAAEDWIRKSEAEKN